MSLLAKIDKIPLYSTLEEALMWAKQYNLTGYHTHTYKGELGYMGGATHAKITEAIKGGVKTLLTPQEMIQGNFVVTIAERNAYAAAAKNTTPTTATPTQPQTQPQVQQQVQMQPQQTPLASPTPPASTSGGGGGGY